MTDRLLKPSEVAKRLGLSEKTVWRLSGGEGGPVLIPHVRTPGGPKGQGHRRYRALVVRDYAQRMERPATNGEGE